MTPEQSYKRRKTIVALLIFYLIAMFLSVSATFGIVIYCLFEAPMPWSVMPMLAMGFWLWSGWAVAPMDNLRLELISLLPKEQQEYLKNKDKRDKK